MTAVALSRADREAECSLRLDREPPDMSDMFAQDKWVRDWLLAILRFAMTLEQADRAVVLAMAKDMDRSGLRVASTAFGFFARTSTEFCDAIADRHDPERAATLSRHLRRIEDRRLRRVLAVAIDFDQAATASSKAKNRNRGDLWRGF
jgi:hypothetical protein